MEYAEYSAWHSRGREVQLCICLILYLAQLFWNVHHICILVQHCTSICVCQFVFAHTYNNSCKARYMQIYIAAATVFQPTFFFCVLFWTWYFCPPTDLLLCSWKILNGNRDDSLDPKWCKWEHVFRTIERKCIPGDTQDTCCCRAWGDTSMILLLPWGTDSH